MSSDLGILPRGRQNPLWQLELFIKLLRCEESDVEENLQEILTERFINMELCVVHSRFVDAPLVIFSVLLIHIFEPQTRINMFYLFPFLEQKISKW